MKEQYFYNPKTRRIHILGYCPNAKEIPSNAVTFKNEAEALAFDGNSLGICKTCLKRKEGLKNASEDTILEHEKKIKMDQKRNRLKRWEPVIWALTLLFSLGLIVAVLFALFDTDTVIAICIMLVVAVIGAFISIEVDKEKVESRRNIRVVSKNCISISKREARNSSSLKIKRYLRTSYKYNPATLTYTSATVGGVTTGGFSYDEEHYTHNVEGFTNKYELWYTDAKKEPYIITDIKLSPSDVEAAKKNKTVAQFLKDDTLHLRHDNAKSEHHDAIAWATQNKSMNINELTNIMLPEIEAKMLTKPEMEAVLNFICGK